MIVRNIVHLSDLNSLESEFVMNTPKSGCQDKNIFFKDFFFVSIFYGFYLSFVGVSSFQSSFSAV